MKKLIISLLLTSLTAFVFGQSITLDPRTTAEAGVVVKGDFALKKIKSYPNANSNALDRDNSSVVIFENGGELGGITQGFDGLLLYIIGKGGAALTIKNEFANAATANRILTHTGLDYQISSGIGGILMIYDANALGTGLGRWRVIETVSNSDGWSLTGNSGTSAANFVGTTDAQPLTFRTNNNENMRLNTAGYLGVGTTNPGAILHISKGNSGVTVASTGTTAVFEDNQTHAVSLLSPENASSTIQFGKPSSSNKASISLSTGNEFLVRNDNKSIIRHTEGGSLYLGEQTSGKNIIFEQSVALKETEFNGLLQAGNTTLRTSNSLWVEVRNHTVIFLKSLPPNCVIHGIPAPTDLRNGTILYLVFDDATCSLANASTTETDANSRILTGNGGNLTISGNGGVTLVWANGVWRVIGTKE